MDATLSKGQTIRKVTGEREGGGIFEQHEFFSLMFPLNEYFLVKMLCTPGLLCMHEFFFHLIFPCMNFFFVLDFFNIFFPPRPST